MGFVLGIPNMSLWIELKGKSWMVDTSKMHDLEDEKEVGEIQRREWVDPQGELILEDDDLVGYKPAKRPCAVSFNDASQASYKIARELLLNVLAVNLPSLFNSSGKRFFTNSAA